MAYVCWMSYFDLFRSDHDPGKKKTKSSVIIFQKFLDISWLEVQSVSTLGMKKKTTALSPECLRNKMELAFHCDLSSYPDPLTIVEGKKTSPLQWHGSLNYPFWGGFPTMHPKTMLNFIQDSPKRIPSRELTYPPKMAFWRWFSFSQGGICEFPGG